MFSKLWDDDPTKAMTLVEKDSWENDEVDRVEYDRTHFFPVTRWLQEHRGDRVTHELYDEFTHVTSEAAGDFVESLDFEDEAFRTSDSILHPCENAMLAIWDVRGELRPWIVREMITTLVGSGTSQTLPTPDMGAFNREVEYRGGPSDTERALANLDHRIIREDDNIPYPEIMEE